MGQLDAGSEGPEAMDWRSEPEWREPPECRGLGECEDRRGSRGETLRREIEEDSQGEIRRAHERKATGTRKETFEKNCKVPG